MNNTHNMNVNANRMAYSLAVYGLATAKQAADGAACLSAETRVLIVDFTAECFRQE